jgi:hypothetical protein
VDSKYGSLWGGCCSNDMQGLYGLSLWINIKRVGGSFVVVPNLHWEMALILDYGITNGMGIRSFRIFSRICLVLLV